jgi:hypothetical protein
MKQRLLQFMAGRNGNDALNRFLLLLVLVLMLLSLFLPSGLSRVAFLLTIILLGYSYFRMFSRNLYKRQTENAWYWEKRSRVLASFRLLKERWLQRKDYRFFNCPSCRTTLRVPRGKGQIKIVCRKCGSSVVRKS